MAETTPKAIHDHLFDTNQRHKMVSVRRPGSRQPQKSLVTIKNIFFAIIFLALANLLVRTLFPKRNHLKPPSVGGNSIQQLWEDRQQQQQLRGQHEPHGVAIQAGHPKEHDAAVDAGEQHSDAHDDALHKQKEADKKDENETPNHPADIDHHEEMQIPIDKDAGQAKSEDKPVVGKNNEQQVVLDKLGTGPTAHGYVIDLVYDRSHPEFRTKSISDNLYTKLTDAVESLLPNTKVEACEYYDASSKSLKQRDHCSDADVRLVAYNDADFTRYLCGQAIGPNQALPLVDGACHEPSHLFQQEIVPLTGHGMPPIQVVKSLTDVPEQQTFETVDCDIPCEYEAGLANVADQYIAGTNWHLKVSANDPGTDTNARIEKSAFKQDLYYSTTSFKSSVPLSYYNASLHSVRNRPAADWETAANKATFFVDKNCYSGNSRRMKWVNVVGSQMPMEAYGSCGHTTNVPAGETIATLDGRLSLARKGRIHLAFEESTEKDHITDIVWESLLSGAVPAVLGSANIAQYLPPNSVIDSSLFNGWTNYAEFVKSVAENKTRWEAYHKWRTDEAAIAAFEARMNFTHTGAQCRTCRWAYSKLYGLGWDHKQQVVRNTIIPRRLCVEETTGMTSQPFRESWGASSAPAAATGDCKSLAAETIVGNLKRTVVQHDGVVDVLISSLSDAVATEDVVIRMQTGVRNGEGAYFPHTHTLVNTARGSLYSSATIQDEGSRITALASWDTVIQSLEEGSIEVVVQQKGESLPTTSVRRIRVITEDTHPIHDKMTEFFPTSFCKRMIKDFVDPIAMFSTKV
ncbi:hypothetical protein MPSEU_000434600 [Mayamaea pseudoterrestris]|nr:hypothetical protein MPSEU_000434600 [Mayamaea pseudoterrestris]